jgi:hypothetical protein
VQVGAVGEHGIDEAVRCPVDLSLGERPELDGLHPAWQRVGQRSQPEHPGRAGQQEATRPWVGVHSLLDGEQQLRDTLDLIDDHRLRQVDETGWVLLSSPTSDDSVEGAPLGRVRNSYQLDQGALSALARAIDQHHPGVPQRLVHRLLGVPRQQPAKRRPGDRGHVTRACHKS